MHRTIEITVLPEQTNQLLQNLEKMPHVLGLSVQRGASVKPRGDVLTVRTLNRGADEVMKLAQAAEKYGPVSVTTAELASINDRQQQPVINSDVDEAIWEEMETGLRHQGKITSNFLLLMALGGVIATIGLVSDPAHQAIAFVACAIIAPGFEPVAKIPLGLILRNWDVVWMGLKSVLAGYILLIIAAAATFWLLLALDVTTKDELLQNLAVEHLVHPTWKEILVSACGAMAGIVMLLAYRRNVIAGPLIALSLIPATALIGIALVIGRLDLVGEGLERLGLDILLIVGAGIVLVALKQMRVHQRQPMR